MKHLITVTIDSTSSDALKSDTGLIYRGIAAALSKTNGSEVHIHSENAENSEAMHFLVTRLLRWSGGSRPPGRKRTIGKKKGWLAKVKDEFMEGLTG
jgi:hypothetical protein